MSYIGNQPTIQAFVTDQFSGNGSTTVFTMSVAPATASSVLVVISGVLQDPSAYSVVGTTLTFSSAPPTGTGNISVRYLGIPASGVVSTAYRTVTEFTATASQTTFSTPSYVPGFINVFLNGVMLGSADYTAVNGTTVVLAVGATVGDLVTVESFYVSSVINAIPAAAGSVGSTYLANGSATKAFLDYASGTGTGALTVPTGTTAQRPSAPLVGDSRWNTTLAALEVWNGASWQVLASTSYSVDYLIVAGGGSGGGVYGGGGGAGGLLTGSSVSVSPGTSYTVVIGAGGSGITNGPAFNGSNSSFSAFPAAIGGGGGGHFNTYSSLSGGSGGGNSGYVTSGGAAGTSGQGYAGGAGGNYGAGGGGGAGAVGFSGGSTNGGAGGVGAISTISGSSVYYAGGGGGGAYTGIGGIGGSGGGGTGGNYSGAGTSASSGTANTGGGGGGYSGTAPSGSGGSGIVIIRYAGTTARASGGIITISGGYVIHTFTSSGTYTA